MDITETRGLQRGLAVLEALADAGVATVRDVAAATGLAEATVRRLLRTLVRCGYAVQPRSHKPFRINDKLARLAAAVPAEARLMEAARIEIGRAAARYPWPLALLGLREGNVKVLQTTEHPPRLEPTRYVAGWHTRPAEHAAGFVIAAHAPAALRRRMIKHLSDGNARRALASVALARQIKAKGSFVFRTPRRREFSLAVPLMVGDTFVGALETRVSGTAFDSSEGRSQILRMLTTCAESIAVRFSADCHMIRGRH
jgi:DNA-binding IclR family transcriptional regulator